MRFRVGAVTETLIVQGRCLQDSDLAQMRQWLGAHPDWSRRRLSRELAAHWGWRNEAGQLKDLAAALDQFHYLGFGGPVGENLQYLVRDGGGRPLACLVFGAAAWKCQDRDRFLGWSAQQRQRNLALMANHSRFLIVPWAKVPRLASWVLGQISHRIAADWQAKHGHPVVVLETFVERERFLGTAYRAANWLAVGATVGRTRQDRHTCLQVPVKDLYLYPLRRNFREALAA